MLISSGKLEYFPSKKIDKKHMIITVHGLNNHNTILKEYINNFNSWGYSVLNLELSGHSGKIEDKFKVSEEIWINDFKTAIDDIKNNYPDYKISAFGFSLGGIVVTASMQKLNLELDSIILLAPAIKLRFMTNLTKILMPLKNTNLCLTSILEKKFRAYDTLPIKTYYALYRTHLTAQKLKTKIPGLLILNKKDELISYKNSLKWVEQNKLDFEPLLINEKANLGRAHNMFDIKNLTEKTKEILLNKIKIFLNS